MESSGNSKRPLSLSTQCAMCSVYDDYHVSVVASQLQAPTKAAGQQPLFVIDTGVLDASYSDNNRNQASLQCPLAADGKSFTMPGYKLTSPELAKETVSKLLDKMHIPFELKEVFWQEKHLGDEIEPPQKVDDLCTKIASFACSVAQ